MSTSLRPGMPGGERTADRAAHGVAGQAERSGERPTLRERAKPIMVRSGRRLAYVLSEFPLAVARFVVLVVLFAIGLAGALTLVGLPALYLPMRVAERFADVDRRRLSTAQGWPAGRPIYRTADHPVRRAFTRVRDPQRWRDLSHGLIGLITSAPMTFVALLWCFLMVAGIASLPFWLFFGAMEFPNAVGYTVGGLGLAALFPAMMRVLSSSQQAVARFLLTPDRMSELREEVVGLTRSRDAAVSAEAVSLRRLERDIHDGPQQRLVRLAMDLSLALRKVESDPEGAKPLLQEAISQTRDTLDELRALSRGIAPPVLADRGLAAALAAVAGRCTVPVELSTELPPGVRLPEAAENAAYFVVAESLTNVAKHSMASRCTVGVGCSGPAEGTGALVRVMVTDDGIGGAHLAKGSGLAGLADRVEALGGRLELESPSGGPTIVSAEVPCAS